MNLLADLGITNQSTSIYSASQTKIRQLQTLLHHFDKQLQRLQAFLVLTKSRQNSVIRHRILLGHFIKHLQSQIHQPKLHIHGNHLSPSYNIPHFHLLKQPLHILKGSKLSVKPSESISNVQTSFQTQFNSVRVNLLTFHQRRTRRQKYRQGEIINSKSIRRLHVTE
ncbi:hypothetical protein V8G54_020516 [Vigna mungo]|uniref:Uncharacterized protein n=1 Tax=Vigna mungo TaxID=3915 RepID=A0AAQ3NBS3_VIGMU